MVAEVIGAALALFVVFVLVLVVGKLPRLRSYPFAIHLVAVALVWALAVAMDVAYAPAAAYLVTLPGIWSYRREVKKAPSGWYRLGMVLTATVTFFSWLFAGAGLSIWLVGWAVQWVREGFRASA